MTVETLQVENLRSIASATFHFSPDLNVIAGVNGVGKSTVLEALCRCVARSISWATKDPATDLNVSFPRIKLFDAEDIRMGAETMVITAATRGLSGRRYVFWEEYVEGRGQNQVRQTRDREEDGSAGTAESFPLIVLFGAKRAIPSRRRPAQMDAYDGPAAALSRALRDRPVSIVGLGRWLRAMHAIRAEVPAAERTWSALQAAVSRFLPGYADLRVPTRRKRDLVIDRDGRMVRVQSLSDGERSCLSIVVDLARRLSIANPDIEDPVREAEAVVLIDEIELHLHPDWQRRILGRLVETFPGCQFIVTTHSPQVIGEVSGEQVHLMTEEGVFSPPQAFGLDSSRVLEEVMEVGARTESVRKRLEEASERIDREDYAAARESVAGLRRILGDNDADVVRLSGLLDFLDEGS